jgi:nitrogen fixation protein FixH
MSEKQSALRSPWIIGWLIMLVIFVMANIVMIWLATDRPGLVVDDYYERGQDYEQNMLKKKARHPGWKLRILAPRRIVVNQPAAFSFTVKDKEGNPVEVPEAMFRAYRPADAKADFEVPMVADGPGKWKADVTFPLLGAWDVLVTVEHNGDEYHDDYRVNARPE